ncbi:MAG TPA: SPOR domain-containing protein [Candidatus Eisenbacteria bacterium]|nr:SPOR domain-containing protein [Candidatus Eisenbacteria bacterium]
MASGGRRGAGERVLESKHVIGLFLLMLVFSGVFFSLGYVMGRNQYDGQVGAASNGIAGRIDPGLSARPEAVPKKSAAPPTESEFNDPATSTSTNGTPWKFEESSKPMNSEPHLMPVPKANVAPPASHTVAAKSAVPASSLPRTAGNRSGSAAPLIPNGAYLLQVAALAKQDDALALAGSLQKRHFSAFVQTPLKDKFYRVQVGPFRDQKSAEGAKKGLESAGFKAFYVKHG